MWGAVRPSATVISGLLIVDSRFLPLSLLLCCLLLGSGCFARAHEDPCQLVGLATDVAASVNCEAISRSIGSCGIVRANWMTSTANFFVRALSSSGVMPSKRARAVPLEDHAMIPFEHASNHQSTIKNHQRINNQRSQNHQLSKAPSASQAYRSSSCASSARSMMKRKRADASFPISSLITRSVTI